MEADVTGVVEWLSRSDPSIRWQVLRDLVGGAEGEYEAIRARVATEGWGSRLLRLQNKDGHFGSENPRTWLESPDGSTTYAMLLLRYMGLDPSSAPARSALARIRKSVTYIWQGETPYFGGETEVCVNGMVLTVGGYFGAIDDTEGLVDRLLGEQLNDGGWNCDAPDSAKGSFHSTICVLEGLLEWGRARPSNDVAIAIAHGEEFLLDRHLFRRLSTGEVANPAFTRFGFPPGWHYDVLRGLDYLREAGRKPDPRTEQALDMVARRQGADGRWPLDVLHPGLDSDGERAFWEAKDYGLSESTGAPSYWNTLRALRVLRWAQSG